MGKKILLSSLVLIVVGLVLLILPDPQFRLIFGSSGAFGPGGSTTAFRRNFNGTFTGNFTSTFPRTGAAGRAAAFGFDAVSIIESLAGVGLVAVGVVFVAIELFLGSTK
jgi:hypothetical protein